MRQTSEEQVSARAYAIWEREGYPAGMAEQHWQLANRELEGQPALNRAAFTGGPLV